MGKQYMVERNLAVVVKSWFKKADNDLKTIENNLKADDPPTDTVCFHAQQAIEKYIKGAFVFFGMQVTKTHDLVNLLTTVKNKLPELGSFENELDEVSHFGVEVRYPDLFYEPSLDEAEHAYQLALKIKTSF